MTPGVSMLGGTEVSLANWTIVGKDPYIDVLKSFIISRKWLYTSGCSEKRTFTASR